MILDKDVAVDFTEYFTDSQDDDEGDGKKPWVDGQYTPTDMGTPQDPELYYSDTGEKNNIEILNITVDGENKENSILNGTSESAYKGNVSTHAIDTTVYTALQKKTRRQKLAPILRTAYYGRK